MVQRRAGQAASAREKFKSWNVTVARGFALEFSGGSMSTIPASGCGRDRPAPSQLNHGEIFARNLGQASPAKLERGLDTLRTKGRLMYAILFK